MHSWKITFISVSTSLDDHYIQENVCMHQIMSFFFCSLTNIQVHNFIHEALIGVRGEKVNWKKILIRVFPQIMTE